MLGYSSSRPCAAQLGTAAILTTSTSTATISSTTDSTRTTLFPSKLPLLHEARRRKRTALCNSSHNTITKDCCSRLSPSVSIVLRNRMSNTADIAPGDLEQHQQQQQTAPSRPQEPATDGECDDNDDNVNRKNIDHYNMLFLKSSSFVEGTFFVGSLCRKHVILPTTTALSNPCTFATRCCDSIRSRWYQLHPTQRRKHIVTGIAIAVVALALVRSHDQWGQLFDKETVQRETVQLLHRLQPDDDGSGSGMSEWKALFLYGTALSFWAFLGLSTIPVETAAGMVFGWHAGLYSWMGKVIGSIAAFYAGRSCLAHWAVSKLSHYSLFQLLSQQQQVAQAAYQNNSGNNHTSQCMEFFQRHATAYATSFLVRFALIPETIKNFGSSCLTVIGIIHYVPPLLMHGGMLTVLWTWLGVDTAAQLLLAQQQQQGSNNKAADSEQETHYSTGLSMAFGFVFVVIFVISPVAMAWYVRQLKRQLATVFASEAATNEQDGSLLLVTMDDNHVEGVFESGVELDLELATSRLVVVPKGGVPPVAWKSDGTATTVATVGSTSSSSSSTTSSIVTTTSTSNASSPAVHRNSSIQQQDDLTMAATGICTDSRHHESLLLFRQDADNDRLTKAAAAVAGADEDSAMSTSIRLFSRHSRHHHPSQHQQQQQQSQNSQHRAGSTHHHNHQVWLHSSNTSCSHNSDQQHDSFHYASTDDDDGNDNNDDDNDIDNNDDHHHHQNITILASLSSTSDEERMELIHRKR